MAKIAGDQGAAIGFAKRSNILAKAGECVPILFEQARVVGTARQRFEREGTGAGKAVKNPGTDDGRSRCSEAAMLQDIEQRLAGPVARRSCCHPLRDGKITTAVPAGDDSHLWIPEPCSAQGRSLASRATVAQV